MIQRVLNCLHRHRGSVVLAAAIFCGFGALLARYSQQPTTSAIQLPDVDLSKLEPERAELLAQARRAVQDAPDSADNWGYLGSVLWSQDLLAEAAVCYASAERLAPREVRWPYLRGLCLERHEPSMALDCMRRAASLAQHMATPNVQLAEMLLGLGELDEAEKYIGRAAAITPDDSRVLLAMGRLAFMRGRIDEALHWTTQAAQLDPKRRRIRVLLCQIYQQLNDLKAVNEQVAVIDSLPAVSPYYEWPDPLLEEVGRIKHDAAETKLRAQQLIDTGHPQEAIALLSQLGDRKSRDVQLLILLGKAHGRMGDFARAKELLIVARDRDPGQAPVHFELGNLARATGSYEDAVGHYQEAVRLEPGYAIAYYHMSTCCRELGDNDGAIAALQQACRSVPNNLRVRRELVELLWRNGQREHALEQVKEILRLAPNDSETKLLLDRLQLNSSLVEPAEDALHLEDRPEPS